jgi:aspartate racemase
MIGILAGMGPKSTGPFVDQVVHSCQVLYGAKDDMDFPHMMIYSCPTPFYMNRPIDSQAMRHAIIDGAKKLESTGVDFIAMPCNTAHVYFDQIAQVLNVPLLNIVDETLKCLPGTSDKVAVLGTPSTVDSEIYQQGILHSGLNYVSNSQWQISVNEIIAAIKKPDQINRAKELWTALLNELSKNVDTVIIACTDLNLVTDHTCSELHLVDSACCLAEAVVRNYLDLLKK